MEREESAVADDMDQSLLFITAFFLVLGGLLVVMVHLETSLTKSKQDDSIVKVALRRFRHTPK